MRRLAIALVVFVTMLVAPARANAAGPLDDAVAAHRASLDPKTSATDREIAQFTLATRLYEMRLHQAAYAVFSDIADRPKHAAFERTLEWLAKLESALPQPADVDERISKYDDRLVESLHLEFYRARLLFKNHRFEEALRFIGKVPRDSPFYQRAWYLGGIANVQLKRGPEAVQAFKRVVAASEESDGDITEHERLADLALLAIARTYYSAKAYPTSLQYWRAVDERGEMWLDALYEQSWALFMIGDHAKALGNLFTLRTEWFDSQWYPEADHLKSLIYVANCQYDDARTLAARFHERYAPIAADLRALRLEDDEKAYRLTHEVRDGKSSIAPRSKIAVVNALSDRELLRHLQYVAYIDDEKKRFLSAPASFRDSALGADIKDALDLARDIVIRNSGQLARVRIARTVADLDRLLADNARIIEAARPDVGVRIPAGSKNNVVKDDDEHVIWPFTGEFWADEAGSYRQSIESKCR